MSSSSEVLTFSRDVVESLPLYYKALAQHLAETGRVVIQDPPGKTET